MKTKKLMMAALAAPMFMACNGHKEKMEAMQFTIDSLQTVATEKEMMLDDALGTINMVQDGINDINETEGLVMVSDGSPESPNQKERIRQHMTHIQERMKENREQLAKLQTQLKDSNFQNSKLKKTIQSLQAQVEKQQARIAELEKQLAQKDILIKQQGEQIASLHEEANKQAQENQEKAKVVAQQERELNAAWYVFGTKKELKAEKILQDGDVLRSGDFNRDYFTQIDIRYSRTIRLYSKSAKLLTSHPAGSYTLEKDAEGQYELVIADPKLFWSSSKYLVIQVK